MILRTIKKGEYFGKQFYGCSNYPKCKEIIFMKLTDDESFKNLTEINNTISILLDSIIENATSQPKLNIIKKKQYIFSPMNILSAQCTLLSIQVCSELGHFSDAFTLSRKFRDDLFQYLLILETLNNTKGLNEDELKECFKDGLNYENLFIGIEKLYKILSTGERKNLKDKAIDNWFENNLDSKEKGKMRNDYFSASKYIDFLKTNELVGKCFEGFLVEIWGKIDRYTNNFVHTNGGKYIEANLLQYSYKKRNEYFVSLSNVLSDITSIFLSLLILIEPSFIMSSDYLDYIDCGLTPPEDSQYWINGYVQEYIDNYIVKINPSLKNFLKENNPYGMIIE